MLDNGGDVEFYGGQRSTIQPSFEYGGSEGNLNYFVTGQYLSTTRGVEPPTPGPSPIHDQSYQGQGFGYFSYFLNPTTRLSLITGSVANHFQIPANPGQPQVFALSGVPVYPSAGSMRTSSSKTTSGCSRFRELIGPNFDYQIAPFSRYSTVSFKPDFDGDLIYNGAASQSVPQRLGKRRASSIRLTGRSRRILFASAATSTPNARRSTITRRLSRSTRLPELPDRPDLDRRQQGAPDLDLQRLCAGRMEAGREADDQLWRALRPLRRPDARGPGESARRAWCTTSSRAPRSTPPTPVISRRRRPNSSPSAASRNSRNTTGAPASLGNGNPTVERDHYFDAGVTQQIIPGLNVGIDSYYKKARDLIDEGQFGPALIFETFNYAKGRVYGVEQTSSYTHENLYLYENFDYSVAQGTQVESGQFNFAPDELKYISNHYIFLDHDQTFSASAGAVYNWRGFTFSIDGIYGSGLRDGFANTGNLPYYIQINAGITKRFVLPKAGAMEVRAAVVNLNDRTYQIRNGTGIGVFAAQYGPRRAFYRRNQMGSSFVQPD